MTLGDIIKRFRLEHAMSMEAFAKVSGLSKAYVSILERNYNPTTKRPVVPSIVTFKSVSTATGIDLNELLSMVDEDQPIALTVDPEPVTQAKNYGPSLSDEEYDTESLRRIMKRFDYHLEISERAIIRKGKKTCSLSQDEFYELLNSVFRYVEFMCDKAMRGEL